MAAKRAKRSTSMERVEEGIYRRPNGKLVVPYYDPATRGKKFAHPDVPRGGFPDTKDGLRRARAFKKQLAARRDEAVSSLTCGEFARNWTRTHPRSMSTDILHKERIQAFVRDFGDVQVRDVTPEMARLWIVGGPAPRALEKIVSGWGGVEKEDGVLVVPSHAGTYKWVRAMWGDLVRDGKINRSPFSGLRVAGSGGRREAIMLTPAEVDDLVRVAEEELGEYGVQRFGPLIACAAGTGMRPGELRAMRWGWIDWEKDEIEVKRALQARTGKETLPKGGKKRIVTMLPLVRAALAKVPRGGADDLLFPAGNGAQLHQRMHWYYWAKVRTAFRAQLSSERQREISEGFDWYELRHYFGSYLAGLRGPHGEVLVSPQDIADQMGHTDGGTLAMELYIHTRSEDARARVRDAVLRAQMAPPAAVEG
jgi:integrase